MTHPKYITDFGINQFQPKPECGEPTDAFTLVPTKWDPPKYKRNPGLGKAASIQPFCIYCWWLLQGMWTPQDGQSWGAERLSSFRVQFIWKSSAFLFVSWQNKSSFDYSYRRQMEKWVDTLHIVSHLWHFHLFDHNPEVLLTFNLDSF